MAQMTSEGSKLLERALSLSVEEQESLADSLISNLGGKVDFWESRLLGRLKSRSELRSWIPAAQGPFHGRKCADAI